MALLVIKGHTTRGREIIEILEMLGGKNRHEYVADSDCFGFFIGNDTTSKTIYYDWLYNFYDEDVIFTLEEFLKKFPYKVGDKIKNARINDCIGRITNVRWDSNENQIIYEVEWDDMIKRMLPYFARDLQPYKEAPKYLNEKANKQAKEIEKFLEPAKEIIENIIKIDIPKGYEFTGVDNQQVVFEKIGCQYPKNFKECCEVLGCKANDFFTNFSYDGCDVEISDCEDKIDDLLQNFRKLIYCRNAYWKIAGEEMGFIPWRPSKSDSVYCIFRYKGDIVKDNFVFGDSLILEFPTEEMRDAFFENFGHLIEICKELL